MYIYGHWLRLALQYVNKVEQKENYCDPTNGRWVGCLN